MLELGLGRAKEEGEGRGRDGGGEGVGGSGFIAVVASGYLHECKHSTMVVALIR